MARLKHVQLRLTPEEYERLKDGGESNGGKQDGETWEDYILRLQEEA